MKGGEGDELYGLGWGDCVYCGESAAFGGRVQET